ncbi:DUF1073 domain protein [Halorubrum phage Hardycor1]|nr:DUF1073 domain protein [Halorubrum phage Hardycor1]
MSTSRGTTADDVRNVFDPGDENEAREQAAIDAALDIAERFVDERLGDGYTDTSTLTEFEPWVAAHVLHAPYPQADEAAAGDADATFSGSGLGNADENLDTDGLRETRYGRMVLFMDTADALLTPDEGSTFETFGPEHAHRGR